MTNKQPLQQFLELIHKMENEPDAMRKGMIQGTINRMTASIIKVQKENSNAR